MTHANEVTTVIDAEKCTGCGFCVEVCPARTLGLKDGRAVVVSDYSMNCDHCAAVCPEGAIVVESLVDEATQTPALDALSGAHLQGFMELTRRRRSCRNYSAKTVPRELLDDLIRVGVTAPSGTNSQLWTFKVLPDREAVTEFAAVIGGFYERLNRLARRPLARGVSKLFMGGALGRYYRDYYQTVEDALGRWRSTGEDLLFHGATAVIVVGSRPDASCGVEDALLATQNILLAAEGLELGSCLIGFAVEAMQREPAIARRIGLDPDETTHAVIALGYPTISYQRPARRKPIHIR